MTTATRHDPRRVADHSTELKRIAIAVVAGTLACGLPLWPVPYSEVSMPGNPGASVWIGLGTIAGVLAGLLIRRVRTAVLAVAGGFVLAVILRVVVDTARDPTSHNLWPFEVVIAGTIGLFAASIGVVLALVIRRLTNH